jgi:hypothetical protein
MPTHTTSPIPIGRTTHPPTCVGTDNVTAPVWLREPEAAEVLGFAPGTLRQWRHHSRGPVFHKVGRSVLYELSALHAFVSAGRVETSAA